jgi:hypothetical protein
MNKYGGVAVLIDVFFTLVKVGRVVRFTLQPLDPWGRTRGKHWIGCWVGHRNGLDNVKRRKILSLPALEF